MYSLPSTSYIREPLALAVKNGYGLYARTGLLTPPGMYLEASSKSFSEFMFLAFYRPSGDYGFFLTLTPGYYLFKTHLFFYFNLRQLVLEALKCLHRLTIHICRV